MKKKQHYVTKGVVSIMLNVDSRTIERWEKHDGDPLPVAIKGGGGHPHQYDLAAIHSWSVRQHLADIQANDDGELYDYETERARLTHEQADKVELEVEQLRGELLRTSTVLLTWQELTANMRAKLLSLPTKAAHAVQGAEDLAGIRDTLTTVVHEALNEIASDGLPEDARNRIAERIRDRD